MNDQERTDGVITTIREMNRCWTETWDEKAFGEYIHVDAVSINPTSPAVSRAAMLISPAGGCLWRKLRSIHGMSPDTGSVSSVGAHALL
ncbi:MAG: hypothetical protein WCC86_10120 [Methanoregula sp.]